MWRIGLQEMHLEVLEGKVTGVTIKEGVGSKGREVDELQGDLYHVNEVSVPNEPDDADNALST